MRYGFALYAARAAIKREANLKLRARKP